MLKSAALREILLVKAIEEADRSGQLLPWGERERAAREAMRTAGLATDVVGQEGAGAATLRVLSDRAARLSRPMFQRYPVHEDLQPSSGWPRWVGLA